jgi:hypothetical protein
MIGEPPICMWCKHYHRSGPTACDAFPERIPDEIWYSCNPHTEPFPGDHGIQFELDEARDKVVRLLAHYRRHLRTRVGLR